MKKLIALAFTIAIFSVSLQSNAANPNKPKKQHVVQQLLKQQQQERKNLKEKCRAEMKALQKRHQQEKKQIHLKPKKLS